MVQSLRALNFGKLSMEGPGWKREVWDCLRAIIVEQLGVPTDRVVESAEFVGDFGADWRRAWDDDSTLKRRIAVAKPQDDRRKGRLR
jgi:hypothetical protein